MNKITKMLAMVLSVAMILTCFASFGVFADGAMNLDVKYSATAVMPGESITVSVSADTDYTAAAYSALEWDFDTDLFTIEQVGTSNFTVTISKRTKKIKVGALQSVNITKGVPFVELKITPNATTALGDYTLTNSKAQILDTTFNPIEIVSKDIKITVGEAAPDPTATPDNQPTAKPTAEPTATPVPMVKANIPAPRVGQDYVVSVTRTDASKAAAVKVVLKNAAGVEIIGEATFAEGETKAQVEFTADQIASIAEAGESFNVAVSYYGEGVEAEDWNEDVTVRKPGGSHGNSGLSTTPGGVVTPTPKPGPGTEPTATPAGEQPTTAPVETSVFTDVPASHWAYSYIMDLYEDGIVNGVSATQFMPDANVTRAEFTKMAAGIFGLTATSATSQFVDVPAGEWYAQSVIAATEAGIVQGISDTEFGPEENITREQMATIIGRQLGMTSSAALTYTDSASIEAYAVPYVAALTEAGYLTGDNGQFNPKANATRAEAATLLDRVYVSIAASEPTEAPEATTEPETTAEPEATTEPEAEATATAEPEATAEAEATETPAAE